MRRILVSWILFFSSANLSARELKFQSGPEKVRLVELYTSEGCSSCPPADRWVNRLATSKSLWTVVVPVVFHVDYWNYSGWKDRFSQSSFTDRQSSVFKNFGSTSIYTPGMIFDGFEFKSWRLRNLPPVDRSKVGTLSLNLSNSKVTTTFQPLGKQDSTLKIYVATMLMGTTSKVTGGENRGKTLAHQFSVCSLQSKRQSENSTTLEFDNCPDFDIKYQRAIAAWVCPAESFTPIQAVGGLL